MTWYQKFKESVFFRRLFFLAFVTSLILFRTLLNRQLWMNPLSGVMGGWGIWETVNGEQKLTTECIENVIMMVPFSAVVIDNAKNGKLLYHLTELKNLESIVRLGLVPRKVLLENEVKFEDVANPEIIIKRQELGLSEYIPFHFHPYTAFDVAVKNQHMGEEMIYICIQRELAISKCIV